MFQDKAYELVMKGNTVESLKITLEKVAEVAGNVFMVLEYLNMYGLTVTDAAVNKLCQLKNHKNWGAVHSQLIDTLQWLSDDSRCILKNFDGITSSNDSVRAISDNFTIIHLSTTAKENKNIFEFVTTSASYSFHMKLPEEPARGYSKCGFVVEVIVGDQMVIDRSPVHCAGLIVPQS